MKKVLAVLAVVAVLVMTGCASTGSSMVKCPSCGYEFEQPETS